MTELISFEEQKSLSLAILADFAHFCDTHGLRYYLAYGTLIGAVRHGGYIPWDDDVDVWMPRDDYDRLIELYAREKATPHYALVRPQDPRARHSIVKIVDEWTVKREDDVDYSGGTLGVDIDVFPLDGEPEDEQEFADWYAKLLGVYKWHRYTVIPFAGSAKRRLAIVLAKTLKGGKRHILSAAARLHAKYPYDGASYVGSVECEHNGIGNRFPRSCFDGTLDVEFEGYIFKIPVGYDEILTRMYGDYMKLPPPEKQVTHHVNKAFFIKE